jgi:formylglycine-generating enzyme required for sulfatase activity
VPGEVDLDQFERDYQPRSGELSDLDGSVRRGDADELMLAWLERPDSTPLVLRGIRGVGKTWQLIHFCRTSWRRFEETHGEKAPAIYVNLGNPRVARILLNGYPTGHAVTALLQAHYGEMPLPWNGAALGALLDTGAIALALDGFDEVYKQPTDGQVRALGTALSAIFAPGTKFVVAGRSVFVDFLPARQSRRAVDGLAGGWTTLDLHPVTVSAGRVLSDLPRPVLAAALGHPALRAEILRLSNERHIDAAVVRTSVMNTFVEFNLRHERTRDTYARRVDGEVVRGAFSERDRLSFLGELAWYMAERGMAAIPVDRLPRRLARQFGLDGDAMRLDVRSQLVLEQRPPVLKQNPGELAFSLSLPGSSRGDAVSDTLTGAVFIAEFLVDRLAEVFECPQLGITYFLRFFGRIALSEAAALFVRAHLAEIESRYGGNVRSRIRTEAVALLRSMAATGGGGVFVACLRHLVHNLRRIGVLSESEATLLDPWTPALTSLIDTPGLVLVPAASSPTLDALMLDRRGSLIRSASRSDQDLVPRKPFLLGVHEVTNAAYAAFVWSDEGVEWHVRRITRAASEDGVPKSPFAGATNEYHLYFWEEDHKRDGYHPLHDNLDLPVSYVSWNAAAAYCDWLSARDGRVREYGFEKSNRHVVSQKQTGAQGYRLPTLGEWLWAGYGAGVERAGTRATIEYPWDWLAPGVPLNLLPKEIQRRRASMEDTQLESGKHIGPVLEDELLDSGVSGLVGNVKEWVDDGELDNGAANGVVLKHVIAGATAFLGMDSFKFGYYASLFSQNTNPDVGFRVARSLDRAELLAIEERERQLAAIRDEVS